MPPAQQPFIRGHERRIMNNRCRRDEAIRQIANSQGPAGRAGDYACTFT
jgi:hypothetical protein